MTFRLDDSLMTGVGLVDGQHMNLVRFINELEGSIDSEEGVTILEKVVLDLNEYAAYHFATEEGLMIEHEYPGFKDHKAAHQSFSEQMAGFQLDVALDMADTAQNLLDFLKKWLIEHVRDVDGPLGVHLVERGVS